MTVEEILALPAVQRIVYEAQETMTEASCFDAYVAEAFAEGARWQLLHGAPGVMDPEPCRGCGKTPSIDARLGKDGIVASVVCRVIGCRTMDFVHRKGATFEDALGRAVAAWNDMQADYE